MLSVNYIAQFLDCNQIVIEKYKYDKINDFEKKIVTKDEYYKNLNIEIEEKITERFQVIKPVVEKYNFIKSINQTKIIPFFELIELIKN